MAGSRSTASDLAPAAEPRRTGRAEHGGRTVALVATAATRLSLQIELEGGARLADGTILDALEIDVDEGRTIRLGRCRFAAEGGVERGGAGRLVFLDDVYDCRSLIEDARFMDLRAYFQNVPLVVAQRERIRPDFKEYCANLAYDLSVYKRFFDEQDRIISEEPPDVAHAARDALLRSEGRRFLAFLDEKILELDRIVDGYTQEEHERHGFYLRRLLWPYLMAGEFLRRSNLKPRGYSGDAEMMLMAYENAYVGTYVFNKLMHKHGVETHAAEAVRNRAGGSCPASWERSWRGSPTCRRAGSPSSRSPRGRRASCTRSCAPRRTRTASRSRSSTRTRSRSTSPARPCGASRRNAARASPSGTSRTRCAP